MGLGGLSIFLLQEGHQPQTLQKRITRGLAAATFLPCRCSRANCLRKRELAFTLTEGAIDACPFATSHFNLLLGLFPFELGSFMPTDFLHLPKKPLLFP
jgi:hypothetical protein